MFGTLPSGVPAVRKLIDYLREVNSCPHMQIMCCGGIYKRAEGLAEEIGADLYAPDAADAVDVAMNNPNAAPRRNSRPSAAAAASAKQRRSSASPRRRTRPSASRSRRVGMKRPSDAKGAGALL
jgi:hypothetical protein